MSGNQPSFGIAPLTNLKRFVVGVVASAALSATLFLPVQSWSGGLAMDNEISSVSVSAGRLTNTQAPPLVTSASLSYQLRP